MGKKLHDDLFDDYATHIRPRVNYSHSVTVLVSYKLSQIKMMDEVNMVLNTVGFIVAQWEDDFLQWNLSHYDYIDEISVLPTDIWTPDFGIDNSADLFYHTTFTKDYRVRVYSDGRIHWAFGGQFSTMCELDLTFFPFDWQQCDIQLKNWAYPRELVDLRNGTPEIILQSDYHPNGIWEFIASRASLTYAVNDLKPESVSLFPKVTFTMVMRRKPQYYLTSILMPCCLLLVIALAGFWLAPDAGEKVSLGISVLLAYVLFQITINETTPQTSDHTPVMSLYVMLVMSLSTLSTISSVVVLFFHHKQTLYPVPKWATIIFFKGVARVLCMGKPGPSRDHKTDRISIHERSIQSDVHTAEDSKSQPHQGQRIIDRNVNNKVIKDENYRILSSIDLKLNELTVYITTKERDELVIQEWRCLAAVLDKLFFWCALIVSVAMVPYFLTMEQVPLDYEHAHSTPV